MESVAAWRRVPGRKRNLNGWNGGEMRKKFRLMSRLVVLGAAVWVAGCGASDDEPDPLDRELDLAMAGDSSGVPADTALAAEEEVKAPETAPTRTPATSAPARRDPAPAPAPTFHEGTVSTGTLLDVSLDEELSTETSNVGDVFTVTLLTPVTDETHVLIPAGTRIQGKVTALEVSGGAGQQAVIRVDFGQLLLDGEARPVMMTVAEANPTTRGRKSTEEKAVTIGAGAVVGGILGRVIGGNATGTIIGGAAGAAAGTAIALGTGDVDAVLEEGSPMKLRVEQTITVRRPL
jgi:hypothetical protein